MDRQPKLRPQQPNMTFANGRSSQEPVPERRRARRPLREQSRQHGARNRHDQFRRGYSSSRHRTTHGPWQQRYDIYCLPCHGPQGDGNGIVKKYGYASVRSLHEKAIVAQPDGEIFHTITHGKNTMYPYGSQISIEDRWAIVAYVRALHRSRLGVLDEVPAQLKAGLK